jgi:hypothetical protein
MARNIAKWVGAVALATAGLAGTGVLIASANDSGVSEAPKVQTQTEDLAAIAAWANHQGLGGLSPASLHPARRQEPPTTTTPNGRGVTHHISQTHAV